MANVVARIIGVMLFILVAVFVLGYTSQRWTFSDKCDVPEAESIALFDYMSFYCCAEVLPVVPKSLLLFVWLLLLISLLATTADWFFVPQLDAMARDLGLPEDVAGVTLLALGNGMPDVMTATSSINKADDFALTMGEMLGAANWILSLVFGCCLLLKAGPTKAEPWPFLRDSLGYLCVLLFMVFMTWDSAIGMTGSLLFFIIYVVYVSIVVVPSRFGRRARPKELPRAAETRMHVVHNANERAANEEHGAITFAMDMDDDEDEIENLRATNSNDDMTDFMLLESDAENTLDDEDFLEGFSGAESFLGWLQISIELPFTVARHASIPAANWNQKRRRLAASCPMFSCLIGVLSFGGWEALGASLWGILPVWICCIVLGSICTCFVILGSTAERRPRWHGLLLLLAFACTIAWFNMLANECVAVLETFGLKFGISSSVLGITVLAWGNSVGDLAADTALVKQGKSRMVVAGVFGSPLLSDLLGLGVSLTSFNIANGPLHATLSIQNKVAAGFVVVSILTSVATFVIFRFSCPRRLGFVLLLQYAIFMVVSVLGEAGLLYDLDRAHHSLSFSHGGNGTVAL